MRKKYNNEDWLRQKYVDEELTMRDIADICGVSVSTISRNIQQSSIDTRSRPTQKLNEKHENEAWLRQKYIVEEKPIYEICEKAGASKSTIYRKLNKYNIETRGRSTTYGGGDKIDNEDWLRKKIEQEDCSVLEVASICEVNHSTVYRRIDEFGITIPSKNSSSNNVDDSSVKEIFNE